jgi:hypothetical protein
MRILVMQHAILLTTAIAPKESKGRSIVANEVVPIKEEIDNFKFVAVFCIYGMTMCLGQGDVTIYRDGAVHVYLTPETQAPLTIIDRQQALGTMALHTLIGQPLEGEPKEVLKKQIQQSVEARQQRYKNSGFVVIEVDDKIKVTLPDKCDRLDDYRVCFDAYDKEALNQNVHPNISSALSAVRLAGNAEFLFERVTSGSYLVDDQGHIVHSISLSGGGDLTVSQGLSEEQILLMREFIITLRQAPELEQVLDLHSQSLNKQETKLKSFMAAWNALELFVFEVKPKYSARWLAERDNSATTGERLAELLSMPKTDSKLAKAFSKMTCYLGGDSQIRDIGLFLKLIKTRNKLSHELADHDLPTDEVKRLFDKYVKGHLRHA